MFYKKYLSPLFIVFVSVIALIDLFKPGLPITHDGQDHVARIANFYQNLVEGNIIPRWAGNLNWGYGHPILMFLYPFPSYMASFFHFLGFSLVDAVKIVFGLTFVLSGFTMYLWVRNFLNEKAAVVSAMLYLFAPYRFVDMYVRGAIGEHVAFVFLPLVFYFLLKLNKDIKGIYILGGSLSLAGFILSHNAIILMFLPLFFLYSLYLFYQSKNKKYFMFNAACVMILGFGLAAFFWVPAFFEGKYTLRDIVTGGKEYAASFVTWKDFFYGAWSYGGTLFLSKQIGIIHWIGLFGSVIATHHLYRKKDRLWIVSRSSFIIFWITLFLMTSASNPIWQTITTLQKFQFPWRFLSVTVFMSALLGGIAIHVFPDKYRKIFLLILVAGLLVVNKDYWYANGYLQKPEAFYTGVYYATTDTGESAPIWSVRFMEKEPKSHLEVVEGKGEMREVKRRSTKHVYEVTLEEKSRLRENTLYFPGWSVYVDGNPAEVEFQDPAHRGLMTFFVGSGKHTIDVRFVETKLRILANSASVISLFGLLFLGILGKVLLWRRFR